jgi:hypothetical protein
VSAGKSLYVIYKLTDSCNFSCSYCYDEPFRQRRSPEKRDETFWAVTEAFLRAEDNRVYVLFHGGSRCWTSVQSGAWWKSASGASPDGSSFRYRRTEVY